MNVMDDALVRPAAARPRRWALPLAFAAAFAFAAAACPLTELPLWRVRVPGAADRVSPEWDGRGVRRANRGSDAEFTSGRAELAAHAAAELAARTDPDAGALLQTARAFVADHVTDATSEPLSEPERCAVQLLGRAALLESLARRLPTAYARTEPGPPVVVEPPLDLLAAHQDVEAAALAGESSLLVAALGRTHDAERRWFAAGVPSRRATTAARGRAFRDWLEGSSASLRALAVAPLAGIDDAGAERVRAALPAAIAGEAAEVAQLLAALGRGGERAMPLEPSPILPMWAAWLSVAAIAGAWFGAAVRGLLARPSREPVSTAMPQPVRLAFATPRDPARPGPVLHVVSGPNPRAVARGVLELAAHTLASRGRVLLIEGSARLGLHAVLEREARWGLVESLGDILPSLGLVQFGGRPGLFFLAYGHEHRQPAWSALGRRLDDIEPHFDRVILALGAEAPAALGDGIVGRALEGWWAEASDRLAPAAEKLGDRLSMALSVLNLAQCPEASLEALGRRVAALSPGAVPVARVAARAGTAQAVPVRPEPVVLDCDLQIQQRLRFLAWMRRVEKESRRRRQPELVPAMQG